MFYMSENSIKHMADVEYMLKQVTYRALALSKIDFGIPATGGLRDVSMQEALFAEGKSNADGIIKLSAHQANAKGKSNAIDFYAYVDGHATWDVMYMAQVAAAFLQAANELDTKIRWGGLFHDFIDMPHIELISQDN